MRWLMGEAPDVLGFLLYGIASTRLLAFCKLDELEAMAVFIIEVERTLHKRAEHFVLALTSTKRLSNSHFEPSCININHAKDVKVCIYTLLWLYLKAG